MERPTGTVTFLFTDIEGSTPLWERNPDAMKLAVARHDALVRNAIEKNRGYVFKTVGDAFCAAFSTALDALDATLAAQRALHAEHWGEVAIHARMGLHTGNTEERDGDYFGRTLNRVARLSSSGHGQQILLSLATAELLRDHLPEGISLRDLGERRLKDLERPERIYQVVVADLPANFPPLRTLDALPNNLPTQLTSFIGREQEIARVKELFLPPPQPSPVGDKGGEITRFVTLTGAGGAGKTRLALQIAADLLDAFKDGVFFVPLASIRDPGLVMLTLAQTIGIKERVGFSIMEDLTHGLRDREMLIVLDNFEQVTDAAPLIAELLSACAKIKILVTSREILHLRGEREFPVPPLSLPDFKQLPTLEALSQYAAVALFIQRALLVKPDFVVTNENAPAVAEICARVDGLPLAIELAAARVKLLPPQVILKRLEHRLTFLTGGARDLPTRQQTLRHAIDWSYELLNANEQTFFSRLAVFVGGCTVEAVEKICSEEQLPSIAPLDVLAALMDQSLVRQTEIGGEARFGMLEMLREYGLERLAAGGAMQAIRQRHAEYFLALAEQADLLLESPEQALWLDRLQCEHENLRAALEWFADTAQADPGLQLASALWRFWEIRGYLTEGRARLAQMLALPEAQAPTPTRMKALYAAGVLADAQCDYPTARALFEENLAINRASGQPMSIATALSNLANVVIIQGDYPFAHACSAEALEIFRKAGDKIGVAWSLKNLAILAERQEDYAAARSLYEESLVLYEQVGDAPLAMALNDLGNVASAQGDYRAARSAYEASLAIYRELANEGAIAISLNNLGNVASAQGDYAAARELYEQSLTLVQKLGDKPSLARMLESFAGLAIAQAQPERALRLASAAATSRTTFGAPLSPTEQKKFQNIVDSAQRALPQSDVAALWAAGAALTIEQAIALALGVGGAP